MNRSAAVDPSGSCARWALLSAVLLLTTSCRSTEFTGFSYDPAGATVTTDKPIDPQPLRTIGFRADGVWFSNEFPGGRMSDVIRTGVDSFRVTVQPENRPINNSPWYAFSVYSETEKSIVIDLEYPGHRHRYVPKISLDGKRWAWALDSLSILAEKDLLADTATADMDSVTLTADSAWEGASQSVAIMDPRAVDGLYEPQEPTLPIDSASVEQDSTGLSVIDESSDVPNPVFAYTLANRLVLNVGKDPIWVSAQELTTTAELDMWLAAMSSRTGVIVDTAGFSRQGRPIPHLVIESVGAESASALRDRPTGVLLVIGRQHPPEIPGYLAMKYFLERVVMEGDSLSAAFRSRFEVQALPMLNPDGVENGHWRHNLGGIDLNRDWRPFNQPETRVARDVFLPLRDRADRRVFYGLDFHSTSENIFYPIHREISTFPEDLTYHWLDAFSAVAPLPFSIESFDTSSPIAKNWIWETFGADGVTYEVDDAAPREILEAFAHRSAEQLMIQLIAAYDAEYTAQRRDE